MRLKPKHFIMLNECILNSTKMRRLIVFLFVITVFTHHDIIAQSVGISDQPIVVDKSAALEIRTNSKGLLIPRLTESERDAISSPATGLLIYQTDSNEGFFYFNGNVWVSIGATGSDTDIDPTNEIQAISISNDTIYLNNGGGYIKLPELADNSVTTSKIQDAQITASKLNSMGASTDQFLCYNGSTWVPQSISGGLTYMGTWNASSNTPTLSDATGQNSEYYIVNTAGTLNLGSGSITFSLGDWVIHNGTSWQKMNNSNDVNSVFGRKGAVIAQTGDYTWAQINKTTSSIGDIADVGVSTATTGNLLIANGSSWNSTAINGDVAVDASGNLQINSKAILYSDLRDPSSTAANRILRWSGTQWEDALLSSIEGDASTTNEIQTLAFTSPNLTLTNGGSVDLSPLIDTIADNQKLTLSGNALSIEHGNSVDLSSFKDNLGNHTATANLLTNGHYISYDGSSAGLFVTKDNFLAIGATESKAPLRISTAEDIQVYMESTSNSPTMMYLSMEPTASVSSGLYFLSFVGNGTSAGSIEYTGTGVKYNESSDRRLKENIVPTHFSLSDLMKIEVCDYNFKNSINQCTGFIAQDLYQIYPVAVSVGGDDANKKPWAVDYSKLTPLLTKSIQELNNKVEKLETENEQLKTKLATLEDNEKRLTELEAQVKVLMESTGQVTMK